MSLDEREEPAEAPMQPEAEADTGPAVAPAAPDDPEPRPEPEEVSLKWPLLILLGPIALLTLGVLVNRELFWDNFVDKYYWNPIVTDGGFNRINTISWAILMGALLFLLARVVQKIQQPVTFSLILATTPYMAAGSVVRVLEDTGYFVAPLRFFFITPIIYVVIVLVAVLWILVGHMLKRHSDEVGLKGALTALATFYGSIWLIYTTWSFYGDQLAHFPSPWVVLAAFVVVHAYFWNYTMQRQAFSQTGVMASFGMVFLIVASYMVLLWHTGQQWTPVATDKFISAEAGTDLRPLVYLIMFIAPAIFVGLVYGIAKRITDKAAADPDATTSAWVFLAPVNLLLVFAQMMDAAMTSLGIDAYGYREKHVLPEFLIEQLRAFGESTGIALFADYPATLVMLPIKLAVALLVVWAIDVYARDDMKRYPDLVGLAKLAIIMVGLAPGVRDAVRLAMDV